MYPHTNYVPAVDCSECLVELDWMCEHNRTLVRPGTKVAIYASECGATFSVETFIRACMDDGDLEFDRDVISEIAENTGLQHGEIAKLMRDAGLKLVAPKEEKAEYKFNAGGTFGFAGLR